MDIPQKTTIKRLKIMNANKMCCKVCRDAGKAENVYTGHKTRDMKGVVVCPTLLEQACRYCFEKGHTPKFCPALKEKEKRSAKAVRYDTFHRENVIRASMPKMLPAKRAASFAALMDDSDEEEDDDVQVFAKVTLPPGKESYADMLKKVSIPKKMEEPVAVIPKAVDPMNRAGASILGINSPLSRIARKNWNWADCESSDEEDEYLTEVGW